MVIFDVCYPFNLIYIVLEGLKYLILNSDFLIVQYSFTFVY